MFEHLIVFSAVVLIMLVSRNLAFAGEALYNGIELPEQWPPNYEWSREPMPIPYLKSPPEVINIDVGRQLLVDDFLIEETTLERTFHHPTHYQDNPIIKNVAPLSGGVWYDPQDKLFKMWYGAGVSRYATSKDGIHWDNPELDVVPGTNIVIVDSTGPPSAPKTLPQYFVDTTCVWINYNNKDTQWRYKIFYTPSYMGDPTRIRDDSSLAYRCSADGIHWSEQPVAISGIVGDLTMAFYNPFRDKWACNIRSGDGTTGRARAYVEADDPAEAVRLATAQPGGKVVAWLWADRLDPNLHGDVTVHAAHQSHYRPDLHHVSPVAYESLMLGYFTICHSSLGKADEVVLGYSRDGFHYDRPDRRPIFKAFEKEKPGEWRNFKRAQSVTGGCIVVGDRLYLYFVGDSVSGEYGRSTGLAFLRRDGFASMGAIGPISNEGQLVTRPVRFSGKYLFVNTECDQGELRVEALDKDGEVVEPFTRDNCVPLTVDKTLQRVEWKGGKDLSALAGEPVRFRFHLRLGELYSFWVSPDESGASYGYVGAGGPGYTSFVDTVGEEAYC